MEKLNENTSDQVDSIWSNVKTSNSAHKSTLKPEEYYRIRKSPNRGRCDMRLVKELYSMSLALHDAFEKIGFKVVIHNDLTLNQTKDVLKFGKFSYIIKSCYNHDRFDCFAICFLSHGDNGILFCSDSFLSSDDIFAPFTADQCASLAGKPKLFFLQSCQGSECDAGTLITDSIDSPKRETQYRIPNTADFLIFYSAYPGFNSWRTPSIGSWFVYNLCKVFKEEALHRDLISLLVTVCRRVALDHQSNVPENEARDKKKQMPCIVSTLIKLVQF
ncbi:Caspase-7 [Tyrophagus putrescentiae]|nr:Caspase-7 [Tyrophagus putrescentiae]